MANTGQKIYPFLRQIAVGTGLPTGLRKANTLADPDYVAPITDYDLCPVQAWRAVTPYCVTALQCNPGFVLSLDQSVCVKIEEQPATPPTTGGGTPGLVVKLNNEEWNNGGALVFDSGYPLDGDGTILTTLVTPHLWVNGDAPFDAGSRNAVDSRMNVAGIWASPAPPVNEWIGFTRKVTTAVAKTVYVGICADNAVRFTLNGVLLIDTDTTNGGSNFNYMNIFPVYLMAGDNYIELYARNYGSQAGMAAEIYDCSYAELIAVTTEAQLDDYIIFSTKNLVGEPFDLGITNGWSCPENWYLVETAPNTYVCRRNTLDEPTLGNTGYQGYGERERLTNGVVDLTEDNLNGIGTGPYYPPVQDLINCPI